MNLSFVFLGSLSYNLGLGPPLVVFLVSLSYENVLEPPLAVLIASLSFNHDSELPVYDSYFFVLLSSHGTPEVIFFLGLIILVLATLMFLSFNLGLELPANVSLSYNHGIELSAAVIFLFLFLLSCNLGIELYAAVSYNCL